MALITASVPDDTKRTCSQDGIGRGDALGELDFGGGWRTECGAALCRFHDGIDDFRMRVAEDQRAPRVDEVEEATAVDILHCAP